MLISYFISCMCQSYSLRKCALWKLGTIVWPFLSSIWRTNILRKFPFSSAAWRRRHTGCFYLENKPNVASQRVRLFFWLRKMELIMAILSRKCKCRFVPLIPGHRSHPHHPNLFDSQKCKWEKRNQFTTSHNILALFFIGLGLNSICNIFKASLEQGWIKMLKSSSWF